MAQDLELLAAHWRLLRVYNADAHTDTLLALIQERDLPFRVLLGVWLQREDGPAERGSNQANLEAALRLAQAHPAVVAGLCVGNETQVSWSGHRMDPATLLPYLREARRRSELPISTADDFSWWLTPESRLVAAELDFLTVHAHPLWNGRKLGEAIAWLDSCLARVEALHPDRPWVLGETGWATDFDPSQGGPDGQGTLIKGEVGEAGQAAFLAACLDWQATRGRPVFWFEAFDESWKGGGAASSPRHVEKHWGLFDESRRAKPVLAGALPPWHAPAPADPQHPTSTASPEDR